MVLLSHLLPPVAVALQQLSVAHPLDLEDLVAHKYSTRVAVVSVLPDRGLQLLLNCKVLLVVGRQVEQHRAWSQGGVGRPSARHQLLDALHKLVPVAVRRHTNLLELLVTHLGQDVHGDPPATPPQLQGTPCRGATGRAAPCLEPGGRWTSLGSSPASRCPS
uniref:Putative secreted protein n=1 Tax=Ixodes ricinus TaxID=34613 RepID=A0A6B0UX53_IXORI